MITKVVSYQSSLIERSTSINRVLKKLKALIESILYYYYGQNQLALG